MVGRAAEPELKLGISPAKKPRPQRSENNSKQFFQDNLSSLRNLAYFAPWRESSLLIASFMSNNKCLHLRGTTLVTRRVGVIPAGGAVVRRRRVVWMIVWGG